MSVSSEIDVQAVPPTTGPSSAQGDRRRTAYGPEFWCAYIANTALMVAITLMYRYADFVLYLDGTEWTVGRIVGVGMVGSLVMRFFQGFGIDHFGPRKIWLSSMALFVISLLGHVWITDVDGPAIYLLRILYSTSVAGAFGASITSVSRSLPVARMAEVIGSLGTSGFIAMALGPQLGDYFCGHPDLTRGDLDAMFYVAAALGSLSLICAEFGTRGEARPRRRRRPPLVWLLRRYHPGSVMLLGVVMGVSFVLPTTFLPTYTQELGIPRTGYFFIVYASTAFLARMATRHFPERIGVKPMIYIGLAALVASLVSYLPVRSEAYLMLPGLFAGISHAVLFPSVTAQGSTAFPNRYRGLGTTVMLAMLDIGVLIGAPLIGGLVQTSKSSNLPPYETMFLVLAIGATAAGVFYAVTNRGAKAA
ncbi:MAG TPA: MFS transporter [Pirellulales bacterium]|jgi:MFS family permease|nr:MFS transporter [Pirellulales bacterium]